MTDEPDGNRPDSADSLIGDIMRREAELASVPEPVARTRSRVRRLVVATMLLSGVTLLDAHLLARTVRPFTPADQVASARYVLYFAAKAVDAYRSTRRELPADLSAVGMAGNGITYSPVDGGYVLRMAGPHGPIEFRSDADAASFVAVWNDVGTRRLNE